MPKKPKAVTGVYEKVLGSGVWYVRMRVGGKLVRKAIGTRQQAIEYAEKARTIKRTGTGVVPATARRAAQTFEEIEKSKTGATVGQLIDDYLHWQDRLHESNPDRLRDQDGMKQRMKVVRAALGERVAVSLKVPDIKGWLESMGHKPATLNRYKSTLSAVYTYAKETTLKVEVNPVRDVKHYEVPESIPRFMSDAEEDRLRKVVLKWIERTPETHRLTRLLLRQHLNEITLAAGTGMRKGNQYSLCWDDVDFDARLIRLPHTKPGKPHHIPMIDDVHDALRDQQSILEQMAQIERKTTGERRHAHAGDRVFSIQNNRGWWEKARREAKVRNLNWHQGSRHTAGSRMAQAGVPLSHIQEALGHATLEMAKRYAHLEKSHVSTAMTALNRPGRQLAGRSR